MRRLAKAFGWVMLGLFLLLVGLAGFLAIERIRPVTLPEPRGPYAVGRLITEWTDYARAETLGGPGGPRQLSVWIWYPAHGGGRPAPYMPAPWADAVDAQYPWPARLLFQAMGSMHPRARIGARPAADGAPFPVLIFQSGIGGSAAHCTVLAEDLASRGYVVVGLTPTYEALVTVLHGKVVTLSDLTRSMNRMTREDARRQGVRMLEVRAADHRFAMDRLTSLAGAPGPLGGLMDVRAFGLWGHSFGGAAAWRACRADARCAGAANLDGDLWGAVSGTGVDRPVLFVSNGSDWTSPEIAAILARSPRGVRRVLRGARHMNFCDPAVEPIRNLPGYRNASGLGSIDGARGLSWTADELDAFFRSALVARTPPT